MYWYTNCASNNVEYLQTSAEISKSDTTWKGEMWSLRIPSMDVKSQLCKPNLTHEVSMAFNTSCLCWVELTFAAGFSAKMCELKTAATKFISRNRFSGDKTLVTHVHVVVVLASQLYDLPSQPIPCYALENRIVYGTNWMMRWLTLNNAKCQAVIDAVVSTKHANLWQEFYRQPATLKSQLQLKQILCKSHMGKFLVPSDIKNGKTKQWYILTLSHPQHKKCGSNLGRKTHCGKGFNTKQIQNRGAWTTDLPTRRVQNKVSTDSGRWLFSHITQLQHADLTVTKVQSFDALTAQTQRR